MFSAVLWIGRRLIFVAIGATVHLPSGRRAIVHLFFWCNQVTVHLPCECRATVHLPSAHQVTDLPCGYQVTGHLPCWVSGDRPSTFRPSGDRPPVNVIVNGVVAPISMDFLPLMKPVPAGQHPGSARLCRGPDNNIECRPHPHIRNHPRHNFQDTTGITTTGGGGGGGVTTTTGGGGTGTPT